MNWFRVQWLKLTGWKYTTGIDEARQMDYGCITEGYHKKGVTIITKVTYHPPPTETLKQE